jgi:hypothetical protein
MPTGRDFRRISRDVIMVEGAFEDAALETPLGEDGEETPVRIPQSAANSSATSEGRMVGTVPKADASACP